MAPITLTVAEPWREYALRFLGTCDADGEPAFVRSQFTDPPQPHTQPPQPPGGPWLSLNEVARRVERSRRAVRSWIEAGRVEAISANNGNTRWWLVHEREVELMNRELGRSTDDRLKRPQGGPWLTASEAAAQLGLLRSTVYKHVRAGILSATKLHTGGRNRWFFDSAEVQRIRTTPGRVRPPAGSGDGWLTVTEFARQVGLTTAAVRFRIRRGHLRAFRLIEGRKACMWLIPASEVKRGSRMRALPRRTNPGMAA